MRVLIDSLRRFLDIGVTSGGEMIAGTISESAAIEMLAEIEGHIEGTHPDS